MKQLFLAGRLLFGVWLLANAANYFLFSLWPTPAGHEPLAIQLMAAFVHSGLYGVAMAIQLVAGALILTGFLVPVALCVVMPVSTCAVYWSVVLEHEPLAAALALVAFALNGLLMLACVGYYHGALRREALTFGESAQEQGSYFQLFVDPRGHTPRGPFIAALIALLAVAAFYQFIVTGLTAHWCMLMLVFPGVMLHARRLHDMGRSAWLLVVPTSLAIAAFAIWFHILSFGASFNEALPVVALAVGVAFMLWGCIAKGRSEPGRFGTPVTA